MPCLHNRPNPKRKLAGAPSASCPHLPLPSAPLCTPPQVLSMYMDCDRDSLIYLSDPIGPACHTNAPTCYFTQLDASSGEMRSAGDHHSQAHVPMTTLFALERTIAQRRAEAEAGTSAGAGAGRWWGAGTASNSVCSFCGEAQHAMQAVAPAPCPRRLLSLWPPTPLCLPPTCPSAPPLPRQAASRPGRPSCWLTRSCCAKRCGRRRASCARRWRRTRARSGRPARRQTSSTTPWCCSTSRCAWAAAGSMCVWVLAALGACLAARDLLRARPSTQTLELHACFTTQTLRVLRTPALVVGREPGGCEQGAAVAVWHVRH